MTRRLLVVLLCLGLVALHPPAATAGPGKPPYRLTVQVSATTVAVGTPVVFSGTVRPKVKGQLVKLQYEYYPGEFETTDLDDLNRRSRYELSWTPNAPGTYHLRVRIAAGEKGGERISPVYAITVT